MDYLSCHMWYQLGPVLAYSDHRLPCPPKRHLANILEWHWLKNRKKRRKTLEFSSKSVFFVHKAFNFSIRFKTKPNIVSLSSSDQFEFLNILRNTL